MEQDTRFAGRLRQATALILALAALVTAVAELVRAFG